MAKRDLAKLGVTALEQLERPLPPGIRCKVKLALRRDDDGTEYNRVKHFEVVGIDPPELDAFAPIDVAANRHREPTLAAAERRQGVNMTTSDCRFGFRIVGGCFENRRLVDAAAALSAHAAADPRCEPDKECYLSAFRFGESFRRHLEDNQGSTAGYSGPCWSPWFWFDLDNEELQYAHKDAAALAVFLVERYAVEPGELLIFFSGSKGFHVGLPTALVVAGTFGRLPQGCAAVCRTRRRTGRRDDRHGRL